MRLLPADERALQAALALAEAAVGLASPNPTVGCVLMRDGLMIGQGAHVYDQRDHAEIVALKDAAAAGHEVRGATAFVTLEPCAHHGRTGPCADALAAHGITRCVAATVDPNPLVRGQGLARLRDAGVEVRVADPESAIARQARRLNDAFAFAVQRGRPFVTLKAALSVDGKLAPSSSLRAAAQPHWLTGSLARADVQRLRHASDSVLTGIGTVLADDPALTDRTGLPRRRPLLRIILDRHLRIPLDSVLVRSAAQDLLLVSPALPSHSEAYEARKADLVRAGAEVLRLPAEPTDSYPDADPSTVAGADLDALLAPLHSRGIRSVLLEAGSHLNGSFLRKGLVDGVVLYYAETELGPDALPFARGFGSPYALQAQLSSVERASFPHGEGEDVRISGYLHDPWADVPAWC